MGADRHGGEGQPGEALQDLGDAFGLGVELHSLSSRQPRQRFHGDVDPPPGAALVPDARDDTVDQQRGEVPRLPPRQCPLEGSSREEPLPGLARDDVGVEVRQQSHAPRSLARAAFSAALVNRPPSDRVCTRTSKAEARRSKISVSSRVAAKSTSTRAAGSVSWKREPENPTPKPTSTLVRPESPITPPPNWTSCTQPPAACHAHHLIPRSEGGATALANLALLCAFHREHGRVPSRVAV